MSRIDRRAFLIASIAATTGGVLAGQPLASLGEAPVLRVIERQFAAALGTAGSRSDVVFIDGDVTALWRNHLNALWRRGPARIEGLTRPAALFCLEQLARGHGHSVSLRESIPGSDAIRWTITPVSYRRTA